MSEFRFLAHLTVEASSEAAAQTRADIAIKDANEFLDANSSLTRFSGALAPDHSVYLVRKVKDSDPSEEEIQAMAEPRYTVELTTEGWQIKDNERGTWLATMHSSKRNAQFECDERNRASV